LTPYCGLEVEKPTQALMSVKGLGNIIDLNPKWTRTLPFLIYCSWEITLPPKIFQISKLIFDTLPVGLRCRNPTPRYLRQTKARIIPLT
jgi:hypothetical protein